MEFKHLCNVQNLGNLAALVVLVVGAFVQIGKWAQDLPSIWVHYIRDQVDLDYIPGG